MIGYVIKMECIKHIYKGRLIYINYMNEKINKYIDWLVNSSKNPENLSLTIKGLLVAVLPMLIILSKMLGFETSEGDMKAMIDMIESIIILGLGIVSSAMTIYGFGRKIYLTFFKSY